jgi:hypothetical protein
LRGEIYCPGAEVGDEESIGLLTSIAANRLPEPHFFDQKYRYAFTTNEFSNIIPAPKTILDRVRRVGRAKSLPRAADLLARDRVIH